MKKYLIIVIISIVTQYIPAQVSLGMRDTISAQFSLLELINEQANYRGLLIPHVDNAGLERLRDTIMNGNDTLSYPLYAKGLVIFNTDINCLMVWQDTSFWSLCGSRKPAQTEIRNCDNVRVHGVYIEGQPLNTSHYISIPLWVNKKGYYEIMVTSANGYFYTTSGNFDSEGREFVINVPAIGSPSRYSPPLDTLLITVNGTATTCIPTVNVRPAAPDYVIVDVQPVPQPFPIEIQLDTFSPLKYYATVTLMVNVPGEWTLYTGQVNGYQFSASGQIGQASGFNAAGAFPQQVKVTVPVTGGPIAYGTGKDYFTMTSAGAKNPSSFPFAVELATVAFSMDCSQIQYLSPTDFHKTMLRDVAVPATSYIEVPVNVFSAGDTKITALFGGLSYSSVASGTNNPPPSNQTLHPGTTHLNVGNQTVVLKSDSAVTIPRQEGNFPVLYTSSLGGLQKHYCLTDTANVVASSAVFTMTADIVHADWIVSPIVGRRSPATRIAIGVVATMPGSYNFTIPDPDPVRYATYGITYRGSGTLKAGLDSIILYADALPNGDYANPEPGASTKFTSANSGGITGNIEFYVAFSYAKLNILSLSDAPARRIYSTGPNMSDNENATNNITAMIRNANYIGPNGLIKMDDSPRVFNYANSEVNSWEKLAKKINDNNIDIIVLSYNYDNAALNEAGIVHVLTDFVLNKKGVLVCGAEYRLPFVVQLMNNIYGATGANALNTNTNNNVQSNKASFTGNVTNHADAVVLDIQDIIVKGSTEFGSFGNVAGKTIDVDANNANWIRTENLSQFYKDNSIVIATGPNTDPTAWYRGHIMIMRHKTKGFLYYGDSGFSTNGSLNVTVNNNGTPANYR
ncbi:MAG: hypothetical protein LBD53_10395, partial [Tannerella sp.]|nr:hypothetical protein [Tannerella sp.]